MILFYEVIDQSSICSKGLNILKITIHHTLKLKTDSIIDAVTEPITAIYNKVLKLNLKQTRHGMKLKTDSSNNLLTVIYSIVLRLY